MKLRVLHVSQGDIGGGANRAAYRLHTALRRRDVDSRMLVWRKVTDDPSVIDGRSMGRVLRHSAARGLSRFLLLLQRTATSTVRSVNLFPAGLGKLIERIEADVIHLHWVGSETLSIWEIGKIRRPVVWTLHDNWSFQGTEHYVEQDTERRASEGYARTNRPPNEAGLDVDRLVWRVKRHCWRSSHIHLVGPTGWPADLARAAVLTRDRPIEVIPYPLDLTRYRPLDRLRMRACLGLPSTARVVLFGALAATTDPRKGFDLLLEALRQLAETHTDVHLLVFGNTVSGERLGPELRGVATTFLGPIHDEDRLVAVYNAADVMVVPSRQDVAPQTVTEALACGTPVVAFDATGLRYMVEHRVSGYLARAFDPADLGYGIGWVLDDVGHNASLRRAARWRAESLAEAGKVTDAYLEVYKRACGVPRSAATGGRFASAP